MVVKTQESVSKKSLGDIARFLGGKVEGDENIKVEGVCGIQDAGPFDLTFLAHSKYLPMLKASKAAAVIADPSLDVAGKPAIRIADPSKAFLKAMSLWAGKDEWVDKSGVEASARVDASARVGKNVYVGVNAVVGAGTTIGDGTKILTGSIVGSNVVIGNNVRIYENVTVREKSRIDDGVILHPGVVVGADGYGYEWIDGAYVKVPQTGNVWIKENVEVGANSCIDRARFGSTIIGRGTKIDNLVQIAHNVIIGENCLIISQTGISGSAVIEDGVILAGQVGVVGHVTVGKNARIGAQSGIYTDVAADATLLGSPPRPIREAKELIIYTSRLPELFKEFKALKAQIKPKE